MDAQITFHELWANPSVRNFFFRHQSENTLQELHDRAEDWGEVEEQIEEYAWERSLDLDDIEEMFYDESVEELAEDFGIELMEN